MKGQLPLETGLKLRGIGHWISAWLPVLFCLVIIAVESSEFLGAEHTSGPLRWLYEAIFGTVTDGRWDTVHHYIRKSGHFLGYGTIGLMWLRAWWMSLPRSSFIVDAALAMAGTAMVASADEFHQSLLPNRTGMPADVLLDCCGALTLQVIIYLFLRLRWPKRLIKTA